MRAPRRQHNPNRVRIAEFKSKVNLPGLECYRLLLPDGTRTDWWVVPSEEGERLLDMVADEQSAIWQQLKECPVVERGETIKPGVAQYVRGDHPALRVARSPEAALKRDKMILQEGNPIKVDFTTYDFAYRSLQVIPATADVANCSAALRLANAWNRFMVKIGAKRANHYIFTRYKDGNDSIGHHTDNKSTIAKSDADGFSLIGIIKGGQNARHFEVRQKAESALTEEELKRMTPDQKKAHKLEINKLQNTLKPFFNRVLEPGSIILTTVEANNASQHGVLPEECGESDSFAARTITKKTPAAKLLKELRKPGGAKKSKDDERPLDPAKAAAWDAYQDRLRVDKVERDKMKLRVADALEKCIRGNSSPMDVDSSNLGETRRHSLHRSPTH